MESGRADNRIAAEKQPKENTLRSSQQSHISQVSIVENLNNSKSKNVLNKIEEEGPNNHREHNQMPKIGQHLLGS